MSRNQLHYKCSCCGKEKTNWEQIHGIMMTEEINGKKYYKAECDYCGHKWSVLKSKAIAKYKRQNKEESC